MMNKFKGLLLDIDNTLYDYGSAHAHALAGVCDYCADNFQLSRNDVLKYYNMARENVHIQLSETASSHNRLLYFQKMLELINVNPLDHGFSIYNVYWDCFLASIIPFRGVSELMRRYNGDVCFVTDLTAHIQFRKIEKLGLNRYCDKLVTSEEAGKEKPHPYIFMLALNKLNMQAHQVCMIGDSFKKDIMGSSHLGITSIWLNTQESIQTYNKNTIQEVRSFNEVLELV